MVVKRVYKQTEVGIIPEDWDVCNLVTISSKITDGDHLTPKREREGNYLLSARNIRDSHIDLTDVDYVGDEEYKRMRQRCAPEVGDILISCSGHGLGRVCAVPEGLRCVLVRSAALVKPDPRRADSLFIQYCLQGAYAQNQISSTKSLAAQPNLFINSIERLRCLLPATVSEQLAIATALSDADEEHGVPKVELKHRKMILRVPPGTSEETKHATLARWYREQIKTAVPALVTQWGPIIPVKVERVFVQRMKTKWGSCNHDRRSIRLNTVLATKPPECLEYIVVHEMVHILEPTHSARFITLMDRLMPQWRVCREQLNRLPVCHEKWTY